MTPSTHKPVLLFVLTGNPSPTLARLAMRHGWPMRRLPRATQAIEQIQRDQPGVVVVQVSFDLSEEVELIQRARTGPLSASVIAVATSHDLSIERAVRSAGAHCYFAIDAHGGLIEPVIIDMLELQKTPRSAAVRPKGTAA